MLHRATLRTLPMGVAFRKLEPDRPCRTTDGGAPRRGHDGSDFLVDTDGVRVLPLNVLSRFPHDDLARGTCELFTSSWRSRLRQCPGSPPPLHLAFPRSPRSPLPLQPIPPVLLLFSGPGTSPASLARLLEHSGLRVVEVDVCIGGVQHELSRQSTRDYYCSALLSNRFSFLFIAVPCKSFSISPAPAASPSLPRRLRLLPARVAPLPILP